MISANELKQISVKSGQSNPAVTEKDYAISWALYAIYSNPKLYKYLVFKGGTCLSKVYVENFRLSEDLDFSAYKDGTLTTAELAAFQKDGNGERLRNIARDEGARLVLGRALILIDNKMKSSKISDVRAALDSFADLWENNPKDKALHEKMREVSKETVDGLAQDRDREVSKKAGAVQAMMKYD